MTKQLYKPGCGLHYIKPPGMVVFRLFLTNSLIPAFLAFGIGSMARQLFEICLQKLFIVVGCHHWFGRKLILLLFLCRLWFCNPFVTGFRVSAAFIERVSALFHVRRLYAEHRQLMGCHRTFREVLVLICCTQAALTAICG